MNVNLLRFFQYPEGGNTENRVLMPMYLCNTTEEEVLSCLMILCQSVTVFAALKTLAFPKRVDLADLNLTT